MTDPTAHARVLLALQAEVDELRELLDAKSHEAGLYARRMEQAQRSRDKARAEERAAVVAYLRQAAWWDCDGCGFDGRKLWENIDLGFHRTGEGA